MNCKKHVRAPHEIVTYGVNYCLACELEAEITRLRGELRNAEYRAMRAQPAYAPAQPEPFHDAVQMTKPM